MSQGQELGTLIVVVLKARNLVDRHSFYKQDVFAEASLNGTVKRTPVDIKGGQHPIWDSELRFPVFKAASDKTRKIEVSCFSKEHRSDDLLGKGTADITETLKTGEFDDWISLDIDGVVRGEVYLEMTYFSSARAPVALKPSAASLTAPHGQDPSRRPSKLSPSEHLRRPPQLTIHRTPQAGNNPSSPASQGRHSLPASHSPPAGGNSALPLFLEKNQSSQIPLPGVLKPGGTSSTHQALRNTSNSGLPLILKPGDGKSPSPTPQSPDPAHVISVSLPSSSPRPYRQPPSNEYLSYNEFSATNPYLSAPPVSSFTPAIPPGGNATLPLADYPAYTNPVVPPAWDQSGPMTSNLTFPMPMAPSVPQPNLRQTEPYRDFGYFQQAVPVMSSSPIDPYLSARYQTPLPPPQGTGVNAASSPHPRPLELRPNSDRLEALKKAEEGAAQRREQEQRDLELALELDRQLNT